MESDLLFGESMCVPTDGGPSIKRRPQKLEGDRHTPENTYFRRLSDIDPNEVRS